MNALNKFLLFFYYNLVYLLSSMLPKKKGLWLFGAWNGSKYSDQARYLFEYVHKNEAEITPFWVTKDKNIYLELQHKGLPVLLQGRFKAYWYFLRCSAAFFCSSLRTDISPFSMPSSVFQFQLWHGSPLKKIGFDNPSELARANSTLQRLKELVFPFLKERYNAVLVPSDGFLPIFKSAFRSRAKDFPVLGYPRIDKLLSESAKPNAGLKKILYAPTYRGEGELSKHLLEVAFPSPEVCSKIDEILTNSAASLEVQLHPCNEDAISLDYASYQCIHKVIKYDDFYDYLKGVDILLTDYSGLIFDFILTRKPVICLVSDLDLYTQKERSLYCQHKDIPGVYICKSWGEVINTTQGLFDGSIKRPDVDVDLSRYYGFDDISASKRIVAYSKNQVGL